MSRKFWFWVGAGALALVLATGLGAFALKDSFAYARIATTYAAKQTCSCMHVSGRSYDACVGEFPAEARGQLSVIADGERVRASALYGAFEAEAAFEEGFGCHIVAD